MDWVFVGEKEFEEINCAIEDIQICLKCGSGNIIINDNEARCKSCENVKSICKVKDLV